MRVRKYLPTSISIKTVSFLQQDNAFKSEEHHGKRDTYISRVHVKDISYFDKMNHHHIVYCCILYNIEYLYFARMIEKIIYTGICICLESLNFNCLFSHHVQCLRL